MNDLQLKAEALRQQLKEARRLVIQLERKWIKANRKARGRWSKDEKINIPNSRVS